MVNAMVDGLEQKTKIIGYLRGNPIMHGQMVMLKIRGEDIAFVAGIDLIFEDGNWKYNDLGQMVGL